MQEIKFYDQLSAKEPRIFSESLAKWCTENHKRGIMLFDEKSLRAALEHVKNPTGLEGMVIVVHPDPSKKALINQLEIEWISHCDKAILIRVKEEVTGYILYEVPDSFEGNDVWYGY